MKNIFLSLFLLMFSLEVYSQENECGLDGNGNINPYSFEICKEDTSFNMVYSLLGFLYDEYVFPFSYTKHISKEQTAEIQSESSQYYMRFGIIFKDIFSAMNYITMVVLFFLLSYFTVVAIFNSAKGDFLGDRWDKAGSLKRFIVGVLLLIPINGISVIQILLLNLSLFSISGANFVTSGFLAFMENRNPEIAEQGEFDPIIDSDAELSIYFDYALMDIKNLTKIAMCRNRSSQYLLEKKITTNDNIEEFIKCNSPNPEKLAKKEIDPGFIRYKFFRDGKHLTSTGIKFGNSVGKTCDTDLTTEYLCGEVAFPNAEIDLSGYDITKIQIINRIISDANSINYSSDMNKEINNKWEDFWGFLKERGTYYESVSLATKASKYKIASYYYHQMIQTQLTVGLINGLGEEDFFGNAKINDDILTWGSANAIISKNILFANKIAKDIESLDCIKKFQLLIKTKNGKNKIENKTDSIEVSSECLYHDSSGTLEVLGLVDGDIPYVNKLTRESDLAEIQTEIDRLVDEGEIEIRKSANRLYMIKKSIMDSFNSSIEKNQNTEVEGQREMYAFENNILVQARQLGWGSFGSLMRRIIQDKDGESKLKTSLLEGLRYERNMNNSMVSLDIDQSNRKYPNLKSETDLMFNSFYNNRKIRKIENLSINKHLNDYIENSQSLEVGGEIGMDNFFEKMINAPLNIVNRFKTNLGMGAVSGGKLANDMIDECVKGKGQCGIPLIHPMETITKLGKDLMTMSAGIWSFSMGQSMLFTKVNTYRGKDRKPTDGEISAERKAKKKLGKLGKLGSFLDGNIFSYITDMMMAFFWILMTIGFIAAYVLPLIPFFIFTLALIGWIIILFQVLVISNIWIVLFFQPKSQGENKEGIQAAYNAVMQLLLRPSLITISLILGWWIFSILIMVVNLTIGTMFNTLSAEEHLLGLINVTFGLTFYVMILYLVLRIAFKIIEELPKKVFAVLGVTADAEDQDQFKNLAESIISFQALQGITEGSVKNKKGKERAAYNAYKDKKAKEKEDNKGGAD